MTTELIIILIASAAVNGFLAGAIMVMAAVQRDFDFMLKALRDAEVSRNEWRKRSETNFERLQRSRETNRIAAGYGKSWNQRGRDFVQTHFDVLIEKGLIMPPANDEEYARKLAIFRKQRSAYGQSGIVYDPRRVHNA